MRKRRSGGGFDEVQFDYVRFPTDPGTGTQLNRARFSKVPDGANRPEAITTFISRAHEVVNGAGGALSADVFGYVCWREDDMGIGQHLESLAPHLDYISPMVYPSTFNGLTQRTKLRQLAGLPIRDRLLQHSARPRAGRRFWRVDSPWLQYFDDYPWATGRRYGPPELTAQVRAMQQLNIPGSSGGTPPTSTSTDPPLAQIEQFDRDFVKDRPVKLDKR